MPSIKRVSVTPYVHNFLRKNYGPDNKFLLDTGRRPNALRMAFMRMNLNVTLIPQPKKLPGRWIYLDLGDDSSLERCYQVNKPWLKAGAFFQFEFMEAMKQYVAAQQDLALALGLKGNQWNARLALERFMRKYEIGPDDYSYDSLRRAWTRKVSPEYEYLGQKLGIKFGFSATDNQYFTPAKLCMTAEPYIYFYCYSRSKKDIVMLKAHVPLKLLNKDDLFLDWVYEHIEAINWFLKQGYSVK